MIKNFVKSNHFHDKFREIAFMEKIIISYLIGAMKGSSFEIAKNPPASPPQAEVVCVEVTEVSVCWPGGIFAEPDPAGGQAGSLHSGH